MSLARSPPPSASASGVNEFNSSCTVCNENLSDIQNCLYLSQCGHSFHRNCIEKYLSNSSDCPTCKRPCELSDLRSVSTQAQCPQSNPNDSADQSVLTQQIQKPKTSIVRGKGRGALSKPYNTRSTSRNIFQDSSHLLIPDIFDNNSATGEEVMTPRPNGNRGPNQNTPHHNAQRSNVGNNLIDYGRINQMIESSVTRILQNLTLNSNQYNCRNNNAHIPLPSEAVNNDNIRSNSRNFALNSPSNYGLGTDKIASIIKNWNLQFDGSTQGLDVEEFLYRVKSLTADNFEEDYSVICKNLNILLTGKAREWFWRYRKQVQSIVWPDFCAAIRYQYKDFKSDSDIREELRSRKQKPGESFESFYDSFSMILDRLTTPIPETELIEMVRRNLRPDIRHELLYVPIFSIAHLRKLIQMRENLLNDESCRRQFAARTMNVPHPRKNVAEVEFFHDPITDTDLENDLSVEALNTGPVVSKCWNCQEPGHFWEDCLKERSVFCYGCGAKNTYKPNCPKCISKRICGTKNTSQLHISKNYK